MADTQASVDPLQGDATFCQEGEHSLSAGSNEQAGGSSSSSATSTDATIKRFNTAIELLGKGEYSAVTRMFETSGESTAFDDV